MCGADEVQDIVVRTFAHVVCALLGAALVCLLLYAWGG